MLMIPHYLDNQLIDRGEVGGLTLYPSPAILIFVFGSYFC
jgi:hypothetical protein